MYLGTHGTRAAQQDADFMHSDRAPLCKPRVRTDNTIQSTVRRIGVIFRFAALLSSKYARFFCILPSCEGKKFFSSRRFLLKYPLPAVKYAHKVMLSIQRTALQSRLNRQICETHCTLVVLSKRVRLIKNAQIFKNYC